jgi:general secretion pathway protein A
VLLERIEQGRDIVLIIDGAHDLKFDVLEQIRLLSNLETDKQKLLQIVLIGRPELRRVLARDELRQLRQRILVHYQLRPLSAPDIERYIRYRLTLAGSTGRPHFTPWAVRAVRRVSKGVAAGVNRICDGALLAAFIRDSDEVDFWDVRRARRRAAYLSN